MKIMPFIIRPLYLGTLSTLFCPTAMMGYAEDVPSGFVAERYSPEVASYVQAITGVALASGIRHYDPAKVESYQVLARVYNEGNQTMLPQPLKKAFADFFALVPDPDDMVGVNVTREQIRALHRLAERIDDLMEGEYGVDLHDSMTLMQHALAKQIPAILRDSGIVADTLPTSTEFRPTLGRALSEAYTRYLEETARLRPAMP